MQYQAVLFDMDGVLIESEWLMRASAIQALADYGVTAREEDFLEFTGCGEDRFVGGGGEKPGVPYDTAMKERAYDYYGSRVRGEARVPRGVAEMLETLHRRGDRCQRTALDRLHDNHRQVVPARGLIASAGLYALAVPVQIVDLQLYELKLGVCREHLL